MNTNEYIRFLTSEIITYFDHPEKRKPKLKKDLSFFFGQIPTSIILFFRSMKKNRL